MDFCNIWIFCNRKEGCGAKGSCSDYLKASGGALSGEEWRYPVTKFGPYRGPHCNEDGTWRYGTCTLKLEGSGGGGGNNPATAEKGGSS
jgi:hypothetical protein